MGKVVDINENRSSRDKKEKEVAGHISDEFEYDETYEEPISDIPIIIYCDEIESVITCLKETVSNDCSRSYDTHEQWDQIREYINNTLIMLSRGLLLTNNTRDCACLS